jgi:hypothetical protein
MRHDENEERGLLVLSALRGLDQSHEIVRKEKNEIMEAIAIESNEEGTWGDLFRNNGIAANKRFYLALGIQFMQQMSGRCLSLSPLITLLIVQGINIVTYYAPTLFQDSLGMSQERSLLLGCFLQLFYIIASFLTVCTNRKYSSMC